MIAGSTWQAVRGIVHAEPVGGRVVKGKRHSVEVFERDLILSALENIGTYRAVKALRSERKRG